MAESKLSIANRLLAVKRNSGKSYSQVAVETGLTNVYVAQLLRRQAQLKPETAPKLKAALPELTDDLLQEMMRPPMRSYDPNLIQEPTIYRFFSSPNCHPSSASILPFPFLCEVCEVFFFYWVFFLFSFLDSLG